MNLISICICTFRRPPDLRKLLSSISNINVTPDWSIDVLVVDNDPFGSACSEVAGIASSFSFPIRYFCEKQSGISYARNRCVREASGDWIAFVDDDEVVEPDWLSSLFKAALKHNADGVFGPVVATFDIGPPQWLLVGGFHQRPRFVTGTPMRWGDCRSGNVLFRRKMFFDFGGFNVALASSGGEDCDFFWRCLSYGANLIWCDEAVVRERVPPERMTRAWLLRRAYNGGRTFARLRAMRGGIGSFLRDALWGVFNIIVFGLAAVAAMIFRNERRMEFQRKVAGGLGKLVSPFAGRSGLYGDAGPSKSSDKN